MRSHGVFVCIATALNLLIVVLAVLISPTNNFWQWLFPCLWLLNATLAAVGISEVRSPEDVEPLPTATHFVIVIGVPAAAVAIVMGLMMLIYMGYDLP